MATLVAAVPIGCSPAAAHAARGHRRVALRTATLAWVGDIAFSAAQGLPAGGPSSAFAPLGAVLHSAQLTMGNLEGTLSVGGGSKCGGGSGETCFAFQAPPQYALGMRRAGFGLLDQANNHALDYGAGARRQTEQALARAGISSTGAPGQITVRRVGGLRVAVVGFAPYPWASSLLDIAAAQRLVRRARHRADLVVAIIHAGAEGAGQVHTPNSEEHAFGEDRGNPRRFAHAVVDAGASLVLGSGPHVIRGIERYRGHLIAYSLGDFAGPHTLAIGGVLSLSAVLRVTLDRRGRLVRGRWIPVRLVPPGLPVPDPSRASTRLVAMLSREDFGDRRYRIFSDGRIRPWRARWR